MRSVFSGFYGMDNSGDDSFVEVSAWGSKKYWGSDLQLFFSNKLPEIHTSSLYYQPTKGYLSFGKAILDLFKSDVFVSAGGSTFHSALKKTDIRTYAKLKKSLRIPGKIGAIGISLGPYKNTIAEKSTIEYLKNLDFLALRDTRSYDMALSYNLPFKPVKAFDLAALLPEIYNFDNSIHHNSNIPIVGISVCNYETYINGDINNEKRRNDFIINIISELKTKSNVKFRFFIFNGHPLIGDESLTYQIINKVNLDAKLNYEVVSYSPNVEYIYKKIAECNLVISTRLHASIFACYSNTPFCLLEYHQKCSDFLTDVGQQDKCIVYDGHKDIRTVLDNILKILYDKDDALPLKKDITIQRAKLNFTETYNKTRNV